ncbi:FAD binding domain-containing protein [Trichoderma breve]|uniref:FAD binding domain-containing protein n=1 Tax=Trichoderma breve TaxID=2034170 RepID=A0A9W9E2P3_9HYPO|nr:FAD binding domain-containing protein [Trichoderma breve]KAJ4855709.1 FAD binding domain-containing protein [Trichoderma breve]
MSTAPLHVGIIGGGIGGLAAAIAIARSGAKVTLLEAAKELGEIGAGIQMYPNISRFLIRWGVSDILGSQLVTHKYCNTWFGSELVAHSDPQWMVKATGFPWWVVRRDHLLSALKESAEKHGAEVIIATRIVEIDDGGKGVAVTSEDGRKFSFDFVVGADGIFEAVPEARTYLHDSMDIWAGPNGYILTYPIAGGKEMNLVTSFCKEEYVTRMEDVDIDEFRGYYKDFHPVIRKIIDIAAYTKRWPLLQMPRMKTWSNEKKNLVLLGDAAHCMQNHMGQGAATAIEDSACLGRLLNEVVRGVLTLPEAVDLQRGDRSKATTAEVKAYDSNGSVVTPMPPAYRSWELAFNPYTVPGVYFHDAEGEADNAVCDYLQEKGEVDEYSSLAKGLSDKWWGYVHNNGIDLYIPVNEHNGSRELDEEDYKRYGRGL